MSKATGFYPNPGIDTTSAWVVSQAGATVLTETVRALGLDAAMSKALQPWRPDTAVHDPAKVLLDLAVTLAAGGDCLADVAVLRAEPGLFGRVASDPTVSRVIDRLAAAPETALRAIAAARATARARAWSLAGDQAPDHATDAGSPLIIDVDATLLTAHSDKEAAAPTFKRGYGHHPLWCFVDHDPTAPGNRSRCCCAPATPAATPQPTTSPCCATRCASSPDTAPAPGPARPQDPHPG